ncbi:hypothetical protein [Gimesia sp.]|uniref:hypothetical protein n=1 Tax=Gimesia sp. TaxID=2024833 RepID=UPI003A8E5AB2
MFEGNLREERGEVKGDERSNVAIFVDTGTIFGGAEVVPGRKPTKCGDPQAYITNGCGFRQCKSGKNRLFYGEDQEQLSRVSVHCKLGTRATQFSVYRWWRAAVKFILCSGSAGMCSSRCGKFSPAGEC